MNADAGQTVLLDEDQVHQAEGKLSVLLGVPIEQAVVGLELCAQFRGLSMVETARQVMTGDPGIGERALVVLRQHLDSHADPLDPSR